MVGFNSGGMKELKESDGEGEKGPTKGKMIGFNWG